MIENMHTTQTQCFLWKWKSKFWYNSILSFCITCPFLHWPKLTYHYTYLKVTIICRYIFLRKTHFVSTKFCDLYAEVVQGRQILMFYTTLVRIANLCGYNILHFWANLQKYPTLVPAKISHLKVHSYNVWYTIHYINDIMLVLSSKLKNVN